MGRDWPATTTLLRWLDTNLTNLRRSLSTTVLRRPDFFDFSSLAPNRFLPAFRWPYVDAGVLTALRWPEFDYSLVDDVVWGVVTTFETVALASLVCFFFVFCGCTL